VEFPGPPPRIALRCWKAGAIQVVGSFEVLPIVAVDRTRRGRAGRRWV